MKLGREFVTQRLDKDKPSHPHHGLDEGYGEGLVGLMHRLKIPVSRESYLDLAHLGSPPKELSPEEEQDLPRHLQKK